MNYSNDPQFKKDLWVCGSCGVGAIDTTSHVLICEAYQHLRDGKDVFCDKDIAQYYLKVLTMREKADIMK